MTTVVSDGPSFYLGQSWGNSTQPKAARPDQHFCQRVTARECRPSGHPAVRSSVWTQHVTRRPKNVLSRLQAIADARLGQDESRLRRIVFELAAQLMDKDAQVVALVCQVRSPDFLE